MKNSKNWILCAIPAVMRVPLLVEYGYDTPTNDAYTNTVHPSSTKPRGSSQSTKATGHANQFSI